MNWLKRQLMKLRKLLSPKKGGAVATSGSVNKTEAARKINRKGVALVIQFEGFYPKAYRCPAGVWTIGYGTTRYPNGSPVKRGQGLIESRARKYLTHELNEKAAIIDAHIKKYKLELNENQFSALVSFAYNLGTGPVVEKNRTMGGAIRRKDIQAMADAFLVYNKARVKGKLKELRGLTRRRKAERLLFLS